MLVEIITIIIVSLFIWALWYAARRVTDDAEKSREDFEKTIVNAYKWVRQPGVEYKTYEEGVARLRKEFKLMEGRWARPQADRFYRIAGHMEGALYIYNRDKK